MYKTKEAIAMAREIISCHGDMLAEHLEYTGISKPKQNHQRNHTGQRADNPQNSPSA